MSKTKKPEWMLDDEWGIGRDNKCWMLKHRAKGKKTWIIMGYWYRIDQLLRSYYEQRILVEPGEQSLFAHVAKVGQQVVASQDRLARLLEKQ